MDAASTTLNHILSHYLVQDDQVIHNLVHILQVLSSTNAISRADPPTWTKWNLKITALIASKIPSARYVAVCLIAEATQIALLDKYGSQWITALLNILQRQDENVILTRTIHTLDSIFHATRLVPSSHRTMSTPNLPKFISLLLQLARDRPTVQTAILIALTNTCRSFPTTFRSHVQQTESLCLSILIGNATDGKPRTVEQSAAQCLVGLYVAGSNDSRKRGQDDAVADIWRQRLIYATGTIHAALDQIFASVVEEETYGGLYPAWTLPDFSVDSIAIPPGLFSIVDTMFVLIKEALRFKTTRPVTLPLEIILTAVRRIYEISENSQRRDTSTSAGHALLLASLPRLYRQANHLCLVLINSQPEHLLPHLGFITSHLADLLRFYGGSAEVTCDYELCISIYALLKEMIEAYGPGILLRDKQMSKGIEALYSQGSKKTNIISAIMTTFAYLVHPILYPNTASALATLTESKHSHKNKKRKMVNGDSATKVDSMVAETPSPTRIQLLEKCQVASFEVILALLTNMPHDLPRATLDALLIRLSTMSVKSPSLRIAQLVQECLCTAGIIAPRVEAMLQKSLLDWRPASETRRSSSSVNSSTLLPIASQLLSSSSSKSIRQVLHATIHPQFPPLNIQEQRRSKTSYSPSASDTDNDEGSSDDADADEPMVDEPEDEQVEAHDVQVSARPPASFSSHHTLVIEALPTPDVEKTLADVIASDIVTPGEAMRTEAFSIDAVDATEKAANSAAKAAFANFPPISEELDEEDMPEIVMDDDEDKEDEEDKGATEQS